MGDRDTLTKNYVKRADRFAGIFNYYLFDGKQRIDPAQLREQDTGADRSSVWKRSDGDADAAFPGYFKAGGADDGRATASMCCLVLKISRMCITPWRCALSV